MEKSDKSPTLRANAHQHEPIVCYGFSYKNGARSGSVGFRDEQSPTLRGGR